MGVDIVLVITAVVFAILVMLGAFYFVVYYQHPQDKWQAWFPKAVVVLALSLSAWNLFLLPLDVANQKGLTNTTGLPMGTITLVFFTTTIAMVIVIVPFTIFYYEGEDNDDDPDGKPRSGGGQFGYAIKYIIPTLIVFGGIVAAMYLGGLGYAEIQTTYLQAPLIDTTDLELNSLDSFFSFQFYCDANAMGTPITLTPRAPLEANATAPVFIPVPYGDTGKPTFGCTSICCRVGAVNSVVSSPVVFLIAVTTLVGWAIFSVFAGVGMAALPYDWLNEFKHRPRPITHAEYDERKKTIGQQSGILMEAYKSVSEELKAASRGNNFNKRYRNIKKKESQFRKDVVILEYHYRNLEDSYRFQGGNILLQYFKFICACLS
jgi:LMBR1 domain-containing protein 1